MHLTNVDSYIVINFPIPLFLGLYQRLLLVGLIRLIRFIGLIGLIGLNPSYQVKKNRNYYEF